MAGSSDLPGGPVGRPLTAREAAVLVALAGGLGTQEAAEELGIAPDDVREALRGAMAALGARSRLEALLLALRAGLVEPPPS